MPNSNPTTRLTVGQAVVRFLAAQQVERDGESSAVLRRRPRHLRSRQRGRHRAGLFAVPQGLPALPGPQRAGHGSHRHRLRQDEEPARSPGLLDLHRTRRHQHDHGSGDRHRQSAARAVSAQRHLRQPAHRSGAAAAGVELLLGLLGQRRLQGGVEVLGPDQPTRPTAHRAARGDAHPDQPGRHRSGDAQPASGRPGGGLGLPGAALPGTDLVRPARPRRPRGAAAGGSDSSPRPSVR